MSKITTVGYELTPLSTIISELQTMFSNAFTGLDVDNESPIGQVIINIANKIDEWQKDSQNVFNSFNLDSCSGNDLDIIGKLIGVERDALIPTVANTTFTSSSTGYTIPAGTQFVLSRDNSTLFELANDLLIDNISKSVSLSSVNTAEFDIVIGDKLTPLTTIPQLNDINIDGFTLGFDKENDYSYRENLKLVRVGLGQSGLERVNRVLLELDNVSSAIVVDKTIDNTMTAGHIRCIIQGGDNTDIAEAIQTNRDMGVITDGAITEVVQDYLGNNVDISFDRPNTLTATFELEVSLITSITQEQRQDIVDIFETLCQEVKIGGTLYYQDFYSEIVKIITGTSRINTLTINAGIIDIVADTDEIIIADTTIDPNTNITVV